MNALKSIWRYFFGSKPPEPPPAWEGNCHLCGKYICCEKPMPEDFVGECLGCVCGITKEGKERDAKEKREKEDRRQIELYKKAIREMKEEER